LINTIFDIVVRLSCSNMLIRSEYHDFSCPVFVRNTFRRKGEFLSRLYMTGCDVTLFEGRKDAAVCLMLITLVFMVILEGLGFGPLMLRLI